MKSSEKLPNPRELRQKLGLNQQEFWGMIGVTQSGGSRYESGRTMPKPVQKLLKVVHIEGIDIGRLSRSDVDVISLLKSKRPELYQRLRTQASSRGAQPYRSAPPASKRGNGAALKRA
jgi:transcriptional regulator with XRE-family HTH domain